MYKAGIFNNPKEGDPEFKHQHQGEQWCQDKGKEDPCGAYAVWDSFDATVYLYIDYEEFEPRR